MIAFFCFFIIILKIIHFRINYILQASLKLPACKTVTYSHENHNQVGLDSYCCGYTNLTSVALAGDRQRSAKKTF